MVEFCNVPPCAYLVGGIVYRDGNNVVAFIAEKAKQITTKRTTNGCLEKNKKKKTTVCKS